MRLEVLVDQQEPLIYPLNKEKIIIGSGENSDILLDAEGISRKHVILHCGQDEFYIIDQGSTNGTFINEERLIPGKRVEFTSFFPVRLGSNVLLTLLSDDETEDFELSSFNSSSINKEPTPAEDSTRVFSRSSLEDYSSSSLNVHKKKASVRAKKANSAKKDVPKKKDKKESNFHFVTIVAVACVIGAIYFQLTKEEDVVEGPTLAKVVNVPVTSTEPKEDVKPKFPLVDKEFIRSKEEVETIRGDLKCISSVEKIICNVFKISPPNGVTQVGRDIFIFLPIQFSTQQLNRLKQIYPDQVKFPVYPYVAYFVENYKVPISDVYDDYRIHLYFLNEESEIAAGISFYPKSFKEFRRLSSYKIFEDFLWGGQSVLGTMKDYFTMHE